MKLIAKTFQGLEEVLAKELTELGANDIQIGLRMVSFTGDLEMMYRANFCLRTAVRVLKVINEFDADDADQVYEHVKQMPWADYMDVTNTFLVDDTVYSEVFRHSKFVAYRVKDAIADYFREHTDDGKRPNVSLSDPDIRVNIHIAERRVTVSLDSSGQSLHLRGYRTGTVAAPINEVLAAGILLLAGWEGQCDLVDPFCGSGTFLVEAALIAQNVWPGVFRKEFGFERWKDFDEQLLQSIYDDETQEHDFEHKIYGFDINRQAVSIAQDNVRSAGVKDCVEVAQQDFYEFEWPDHGPTLMITNPPYGERLQSDDILELYDTIGQRLKKYFTGNDVWIISAHEELFGQIGFRPSTKFALLNGQIPCELRRYHIFEGRLDERREEGMELKTDEELERNTHYKPHRMKNIEEDENEDGRPSMGRSYGRTDSYRGDHGERRAFDRDGRKPFRRDDRKDNRHEERKPARRPLFEGDGDPEPNRYNFKWGDRGSDYEHREKPRDRGDRDYGRDGRRGDRSERDGYHDRRPYRRDERDDNRDERRNSRYGNREYNRDERRPYRRDDRDHDRDDRRNSRRDDRRDNRGERGQWGFDRDGRPFRRDD